VDLYSFCETVTAGGNARWHIRRLTDKGMMLGGGADSESLCGANVAWDVDVPITDHHLNHSCQRCVEVFRAAEGK